MKDNKRTLLLSEEKIPVALLKLSIPTVLAMMVMAVYNLADTYFVSLLNDTASIAATGVVFPIFMMIGGVGLTFGIGAGSVISVSLGEKDITNAKKAASTAFYLSLVTGIVLSILGAIFIKPLLELFGATETIMLKATLYGRIIIGLSVFPVTNMCLNNLLRSEGAAGASAIAQIGGAVINIILDPFFILQGKVFGIKIGLGMGITGAAVATVIAQLLSTAFLLSYFFKKRSLLRLSIRYFTPTVKMIQSIMVIGLPTFARLILQSLGVGLLNKVSSSLYGDSALATMSVVGRVTSLSFMALFGMGQGLQPLAGFNYGAKQFKRMHQTLKAGIFNSSIFCILSSLIFFFFAKNIMMKFGKHDLQMIEWGTFALKAFSLGFIFSGAMIIIGSYFQALKRGGTSLIVALAQQGLILIPLFFILVHFFGIHGLFAAQPASFIISFILTLFMLHLVEKSIKKEITVYNDQIRDSA